MMGNEINIMEKMAIINFWKYQFIIFDRLYLSMYWVPEAPEGKGSQDVPQENYMYNHPFRQTWHSTTSSDSMQTRSLALCMNQL